MILKKIRYLNFIINEIYKCLYSGISIQGNRGRDGNPGINGRPGRTGAKGTKGEPGRARYR